MQTMDPLIEEAEGLGLFQPHGASMVHCAHCHARLDPRGDCATCGLIGRSAQDTRERAAMDPGLQQRLETAIAKRRAYTPLKPEKR